MKIVENCRERRWYITVGEIAKPGAITTGKIFYSFTKKTTENEWEKQKKKAVFFFVDLQSQFPAPKIEI